MITAHTFRRALLSLAASLAMAVGASSARAADWNWQLPDARYQQMGTFERAEYDKAAKLFTQQQYLAAATEFAKFKAQFTDSPILSYALFMRGYSLQEARHRNEAIKQYQEVLDFFPDQADDAAASEYYMGMAYLDDGETTKGLHALKAMVDNPKYQKHSLAAGALRRLADNDYNNKDFDSAVRYWTQCAHDFKGVNDKERAAALDNLAKYCITIKDYSAYENACLDDKTRQQPQAHRWLIENLWNNAWSLYQGQNTWQRKTPATDADKAAEKKALFQYVAASRPWWSKTNYPFGYYDYCLRIQVDWCKDRKEQTKLLNEAMTYVNGVADKTAADRMLTSLIDRMRDARDFESARLCEAHLNDRTLAAYKEYEICVADNQINDALKALDQVQAAKGDWPNRAIYARAHVYKDNLGQYDKAIALFQQLNQPPQMLWEIQDCYKRAKKLDSALSTLTEIENMFPDQSSRALWTKVQYLNEAGEKARTIAEAKKILKMYPKSPESVSAHDLLKEMGVELKSGAGGVAN